MGRDVRDGHVDAARVLVRVGGNPPGAAVVVSRNLSHKSARRDGAGIARGRLAVVEEGAGDCDARGAEVAEAVCARAGAEGGQ